MFLILYYLIGSYFLFYALYWLVLAFFGRKSIALSTNSLVDTPELLVLIPAYKPNQQLIKALKALHHAPKPMSVEVYVLLQEASPQITADCKQFPFVIVTKDFVAQKGQNVYHQVLRYSCQMLATQDYTHLLLLDKDNCIQQDYFEQLQGLWQNYGDRTVWQGIRKPLRVKEPLEAYDALSEDLNNHFLRQAKNNLGLPAELSGSGAIFKRKTFEQAVNALDGNAPGMDKNLLVQLLLQHPQLSIGYAPNLIVQEEKIDDVGVLQQQRSRWFGNQYYNAMNYTFSLIKTGRMACIDYALALCRPPRLWQATIVPALGLAELLFASSLYLFAGSTVLFGIGLLLFLSIKAERWQWAKQLSSHLFTLLYSSFYSVFQGFHPKNKGKFIHTKRSS